MDNFKAVYKILSQLERDMDKPEADVSKFDNEALNVSEERWLKYLEMMSDVGYIKGVRITEDLEGMKMCNCNEIRITLRGLEYLQENGIMKKIYKTAKGIKEITPGM